MKKKLILLAVILMGSAISFSSGSRCLAQKLTAERAFIESPDYVFPVLDSDTKKNMVALFHSFAEGKSTVKHTSNLLGDTAQIVLLSPSLIQMTLDSATEVQIKLLPMVNNTSLICMVVTSLEGTHQSIVKFYSWDWKEVQPTDIISLPKNNEFLKRREDAESIEYKNALVERGMMTFEARFDADEPIMTLRLTTFDSKEAQQLHPKIAEMIKGDGISYTWTGSRFKRIS